MSFSSSSSRGRKQSAVSSLFKVLTTSKKTPQVECTFCALQMSKNGTRMAEHIRKCLKCPVSVKEKYGVIEKMKQQTEVVTGVLAKMFHKKEAKVKEKLKVQPQHVPSLGSLSVASFMDKMAPDQKEKADELLSRAIFSSQAPLALVENSQWQEFFKYLRPAYEIPSRHLVSGPLLDKEHQRVTALVSESIAAAHSVGLMVDGWSNIRNESVLNFVVTTPKPFLFKIMATGLESHTAAYMARTLGDVIREIGPQKVFGIVTDNAANMKAAWALIQDDFEGRIFTYGCFAHSLNLIFTDLKNLASLKSFTAEAIAVTKAIRQSHSLSAWLREKQKELKINCCLKLPVPTRWGSLVHCFQSLLTNKQIIKAMAIDEKIGDVVSKHPPLKKNALSDVFWDRIKGYFTLLEPIASTITAVEGDKPTISKCLILFNKIIETAFANLTESPLPAKEEATAKEIFKNRKEFSIYGVHLVANLLDPRYRGCELTPDEKTDATEVIYKAAQRMPDVNEASILADVANFVAKEGTFKKAFLWNTDTINSISPIAWWSGLCSNTELSNLAIRFLELPATSAACERSFSSYGGIHSKKRNRLTNSRAAKIVYVAHNLKLMAEAEPATEESPRQSSEPTAGPSCEARPAAEDDTMTMDDSDSGPEFHSDGDVDTDIDMTDDYSE